MTLEISRRITLLNERFWCLNQDKMVWKGIFDLWYGAAERSKVNSWNLDLKQILVVDFLDKHTNSSFSWGQVVTSLRTINNFPHFSLMMKKEKGQYLLCFIVSRIVKFTLDILFLCTTWVLDIHFSFFKHSNKELDLFLSIILTCWFTMYLGDMCHIT